MSLNKICEIWQLWNNRKLEEKEALLRIGKYVIPYLVMMDKIKKKSKLYGKCICGHGKRRHNLLDKDNTCSECYSIGKKCKGYNPINSKKEHP